MSPRSREIALGFVPRAHAETVAALVQELPQHSQAMLVGTSNSSLGNIAFHQKCGFRMHEVRRDFFDYIQPPIVENGIEMRDMIVFLYDVPLPSAARRARRNRSSDSLGSQAKADR